MSDHVSVIWSIPLPNKILFWNLPENAAIVVNSVVLMSWIIMGIVLTWAVISTRKLKTVPKGAQNFAEFIVDMINNFVKGLLPHRWKSFSAYIGTIGIFLFIANTLGALFMTTLTHGVVSPPTRTLAIPAALAIMTITIVIVSGIRAHGFGGFLKSLFKPVPIMFPFKILEFFIKPLSLCLRLYGNIFGAYIIMEMILANLPWGLPAVACMYFDLFDGLLQAFVFVLLTTLYISEEVEVEE